MTDNALTYTEFRTRRYVPALDGLRALAVLLVLAQHLRAAPLALLHGTNGVLIFFVISGFLITTLALREEEETGQLSLKGFFIRRVFRIFPLYYLVLAVYTVLALGIGLDGRGPAFSHALPYYTFYFQEWPFFRWNFSNPPIPFIISWSLGIEEKFYLVWPILGFVALRKSMLRLPTVLGLAAVFVIADIIHPNGYSRLFLPYAHILLGCALALVLNRPAWYQHAAKLGNKWVLGIAAAVTSGATFIPFPERFTILFTLIAAVFFVSVVTTKSSMSRSLASRPLVRLGKLSYAFYLTHHLALTVADHAIPAGHGRLVDISTVIIALPITIGACEILHRYWEKPFIRLGHKLSGRTSPAPIPAIA